MTEKDYKAVQTIKLSEPVPTELIPLLKRYMQHCPMWMRECIKRYISNSQ